MDVNPTARSNRSTSTQPIDFSVQNPKGAYVNLSSAGYLNVNTPVNMHAEVGAMLKSESTGGVGTLTVLGEDVCSSCTTNVRLIAESQNLINLTVNECSSGYVYSFNGIDNEFFAKPQGGVTWNSGRIN